MALTTSDFTIEPEFEPEFAWAAERGERRLVRELLLLARIVCTPYFRKLFCSVHVKLTCEGHLRALDEIWRGDLDHLTRCFALRLRSRVEAKRAEFVGCRL